MSANLMSLARSGGKFLKLFGDRKMLKTMPTARDYVQDGLVAMWDGIENAGWGKHNTNATIWKDLIGTYDMSLIGGCYFKDESIFVNSNNQRAECGNADELIDSIKTMECVFRIGNISNAMMIGTDVGSIQFAYGNLMFQFSQSSVEGARGFSAKRIRPNTIHSMGSTYPTHGSTDGDGYVDGAKIAVERAGIDLDPNSSGWLTIGSRHNNAWGCERTDIFCVRIYSRVLTVDEIANNYAIDKARFNLKTPTI